MDAAYRKTTSISIGVANAAVAREIVSAMMGKPTPAPGDERDLAERVTLKYLRSFDASKTAGVDAPVFWIDFSLRFGSGADGDGIADWLVGVLGEKNEALELRFDNNPVGLDPTIIRNLVRDVLKRSL